jgi:hypothetical protein
VLQVASQAEPVAKEVTDGVVRPGAKAIGETAAKYSDDDTKQRVQVATKGLAEQVRGHPRAEGAGIIRVPGRQCNWRDRRHLSDIDTEQWPRSQPSTWLSRRDVDLRM